VEEKEPIEMDKKRWLYTCSVVVMFVLFALIRFVGLYASPGWEWDEGVYAKVGENLFYHNQLMTKNDILHPDELYIYHPPFHFYLLHGWFTVTSLLHIASPGIESARVLAVVMSLLMLGLLWYFFAVQLKLGAWSLIPLLLLGIDGWLVYTSRVSWIENTMMVLGIAGLVAYQQAIIRERAVHYALAGILVGGATIYKHVGAYFIGAIIVSWCLLQKDHRNHLALLLIVVAIMLGYGSLMAGHYDDTFVRETFGVQWRRTTGVQESRGNPTSVTVYMQALLNQYSIFIGTVSLVAGSIVILVYESARALWRKNIASLKNYSVLVGWVVSSIIFFGTIRLRMPHYFLMLFIPMIGYIGYKIALILRKQMVESSALDKLCWALSLSPKGKAEDVPIRDFRALPDMGVQYAQSTLTQRKVFTPPPFFPAAAREMFTPPPSSIHKVFAPPPFFPAAAREVFTPPPSLPAVVGHKKLFPKSQLLNYFLLVSLVVTIILNFYALNARLFVPHDDALRSSAAYINTHAHKDEIVLTEESIGVLIEQRYCKLYEAGRAPCRFSWVVLYLSTTQGLPKNQCLEKAVLPQYAQKVAVFKGFKEEISVYRMFPGFTCRTS
jgi:hypothetical protein